MNEATNFEIQKENVQLIGVPICAAMFDELKAFEVVDKLVELCQQGMLTIGLGDAGEMLYNTGRAPTACPMPSGENFML